MWMIWLIVTSLLKLLRILLKRPTSFSNLLDSSARAGPFLGPILTQMSLMMDLLLVWEAWNGVQ